MTSRYIYSELKQILSLVWEDDDMMTQETLFEVQERLADLTLKVAQDCGNDALNNLVKAFPYLYTKK
mgnify:CR=1 FL=1